MGYATLMVQLLVGHSNAALLRVTADLAERFRAQVIGIGACQPIQMIYGDAYGYMTGELIEQDRKAIDREMKDAESEFRSILGERIENLEWRSIVTYDPLSEHVAREARSADLVLTSVDPKLVSYDGSRHVEVGDLAMRTGRPVLVVPSTIEAVSFCSVVVGWKDTRETRRVIVDALPILKGARQVTLAEICAKEELDHVRKHLDDVVRWLGKHDILAEARAITSSRTDEDAAKLAELAQNKGADLLVGGAYGHSRLREWALGGVTRDLLLRADRCSLVSH